MLELKSNFSVPENQLSTKGCGLGDSLTRFASQAEFLWGQNIPSASAVAREERRELIGILASSQYIDVLTLVRVVRMSKNANRAGRPWPPPYSD